MEECDIRLVTKAIDKYKELYGEGQMDIFKFDKIVEELKQKPTKAKRKGK